MAQNTRTKNKGFVGLQLTPDLLKKLDEKMKATTLNRSQIIRLAIIEYLKQITVVVTQNSVHVYSWTLHIGACKWGHLG